MSKKKIFVFAISIICFFYVAQNVNAQKVIADFKSFTKEFKNPSKDYGTVPFFVLNDDVTKEEIERNMRELKENGCGGVIYHPRPGLITEYLSQKWFELFKHAVNVGKKIAMNVWIYDENSYPSGFAGGHVPAQMPESYNEGMGLNPSDATQIPADYKKYFIILKKENEKYVDVISAIEKEIGKKGEYIFFEKTFKEKSGWSGGYSYVDLLHKGVTEKFLDITIPGYKKAVGNEFGKIVQGVFTDEPEINTPGGIRWTRDLFEVFQNQCGYDLKTNLPLLYKEIGDWKKVRYDYTRTILTLFIERWSIPASEYYKRLGLRFTGHYWEHGWPQMRLGPDNMAMYAYHDVPAIDLLFNQFDEVTSGAQFGNIRSVKELASVANQFGRTRKLSETYGGAGWEVTFKDLKRLGDWEYVLGVNIMNQHLHFFSIAGTRKYDYPPSFSYHNPWFKSYSYLNKYYDRLSVALSSGKQINKILILEPTTTAWMYDSYLRKQRDSLFYKLGDSFQKFVTALEKKQVEYDLGSEDIITKHGKASKEGFTIGERIYSLVVIPPMTENLDKPTFELLKQYTANGGKIVAHSVPSRINGELNNEVVEFFKSKKVIHAEELSSDLIYYNGKNIFENVKGGNLYHHRRQLEDGQIVFLVNSSLDNAVSGSMVLEGSDAIMLNAFTGKYFDYDETKDGKNIRLDFKMSPAESILLYVSNKKLEGYKKIIKHDVVPVATTQKISSSLEKENVLPIDFCDLQVNGKTFTGMHTYNANQQAFIEHGFAEGDPWDQKVQYKTNILDKNHFAAGTGFTAIYHFTIKEKFDYSNIKAVVERPGLWTVSINGNEVKNEKGKWWLDRSFGVYQIGKWINTGENIITVKCSPMSVHAEIEPVYILGNFSVQPADKGWVINAPKNNFTIGSWKEQGYPFYSWGASYKKEFNIEQKSFYYEIGLGNWKGTCAEVFINGKAAGTIVLPTDRIDVTKMIKKGKNEVEIKIIGSLKNLLGPHHNNPAPGFVGFVSWRDVKEMPAGKDYQLFDYGLMDDFYLYQQK
jgi:hypothetical protein